MIKVEWLAAGALEKIPSSVELVNGQLRWRRNCTLVLHRNQRHTELTNKKELIMTKQTQIIYSSGKGFAFTSKNKKILELNHLKILKTCRDRFVGLDLYCMPNKLQSISLDPVPLNVEGNFSFSVLFAV
jgi:hypothetical protein